MQLSQLFKFTPEDEANQQALIHHAEKSRAGFQQMISTRRVFLESKPWRYEVCSNELKEISKHKAQCQMTEKQLSDLYDCIKSKEDLEREEQQLQTDMMRRLQMQEKLITSICSLISRNSKNSTNQLNEEHNNRSIRRLLKAIGDTHQMTNRHWVNIEGNRGSIIKK